MKSMCKAFICGLAVTAVTAVGCSSGQPVGHTGLPGTGEHTGEVGLNLTLQGGQTLTSLNYTLSNGVAADGQTGTIPLGTGTAPSGVIVVPTFEIVPVAAATGYTLTLTGTSSAGTPVVTCTGTSAVFAVTAGNETVVPVLVTCTATNTSGSIEVNPTLQNCPTIGDLTAINSTANTTAPGNTSTIFAAAVGPNAATLTYTFSVVSPGTGTLGTPVVAAGNASASVVFTCPTTGQTDTIQVVTADQSGAVCPASLTTATVTVTCGVPPAACTGVGTGVEATPDTAAGTCPAGQTNTGTLQDSSGNFCCSLSAPCAGVGSGTEATPDTAAGTCPSGQTNSLKDANGNFCCVGLVACTTAGQTGCVTCTGNASGICSPTEADFVGRDIALGLVTAAGPDSAATNCYPCLWQNSCIDDTVNGDVNHECEDTGITTGTATQCETVITCILGSGTGSAECASNGVSTCYCGTDSASACSSGTSTAPVTAGVNGTCDTAIAAGLGFPLGDGSDIGPNFTATTRAAGRADQIFTCARSNTCSSCL
jgi:hypothetical protein